MAESRRLPVYLLLDTSGSMMGEPIEAVRQGLRALVSDLRGDPQALETAHLSVIAFNTNARQLCPLTDLLSFQEPALDAAGTTSLGEALILLEDSLENEVRKASPTQRGDWKPLIFLMTDGQPTDDWEEAAARIKQKKVGNLIACAAGTQADSDVLKQITDNVVELQNLEPNALKAFFKWVSDSIKTASQAVAQIMPDPVAAASTVIDPLPLDEILQDRRFPIYLVLDTSGSMAGEPIEVVRQGLRALVSDLRSDPQALATAYLSVITFGEGVRQVCPLTELVAFVEPDLHAAGPAPLGEALTLLEHCLDTELRKPSMTDKGDLRALIIVMSNGRPTDDWEEPTNRIEQRKPGVILACAVGPKADSGVLKRITNNVFELQDSQPDALEQFWWWTKHLMNPPSDLPASSVPVISH